MGFQKGQSGNPNGRPRVGLTIAEHVRKRVGKDGRKLVLLWYSVAFGHVPKGAGAEFEAVLQDLTKKAELRDRLSASRLLAERGFGTPLQEVEHSGEVGMRTTVVHEHQTVAE